MKKGTSLYLDLVRFSAALMVFLEHLREHTKISFAHFWKSHPFWYSHSNPYAQTAVMVFFVLSGYVIAYVMTTRESTPLDYAASRFGRLYSVVIPALLLTYMCNFLMALKYPGAFQAFEAGGGLVVGLRYLGTALFVNQYWLWPELDPPNSPFWTLSCEATYYAGIALFAFGRGRTRFLSLALLGLLAGPTITLLAPIWLLGYGTYHVSRRGELPASAAIFLWLGSGALLLVCSFLEYQFRQPLNFLRMPDKHVGELVACYAAAVCFAVNLLAFNPIADHFEKLVRTIAGPIRWLGSTTFALYLFHQPLLSFFTVYGVEDLSSHAQPVLMIGGTLLIVVTLGHFCEQSKGAYKKFFLSIWLRASARPAMID